MKTRFNIHSLLFLFPISLSIYFYLISIIFTLSDKDFNLRWINFTFWIFSLITIPFYLLIKHIKRRGYKIHGKELYAVLFIMTVAGIFTFAYLNEYPFVSIYDQVRDGGLNARQILDGSIKNIFSYGRYSSHGLIIPTIGSFFYLFFKNSVLTFRFPAALFTLLSVGILYITIKANYNRGVAFWSAAILSTLPLVLYYARTEVVVVYSLFLFSLIINRIAVLIKKQDLLNYILLATLLGFSCGFHTSIRTVAILTLIGMLGINLFKLIEKKESGFFKNILSSIVFFLVGFGPRILFTSFDTFFQTRSFSPAHASLPIINNLMSIIGSYINSLLVYVLTPTISTHYPDFHPILNPISGVFFLVGFIILIRRQDAFSKVLSLFILIIPFTNSAITDTINSDNRLAPLFILSAILAGIGIDFILSKLKIAKLRILVEFLILLFFIYQGVNFFVQEKTSKQYNDIDYLSMYTALYLKNDNNYKLRKSVCLFANSKFLNYAKLLHVQEQYEFFAPGTIKVVANDMIRDNEIYISKSCSEPKPSDYKKIVYCDIKRKFVCKDSRIILYIEKTAQKKAVTQMQNSIIINPAPVFIP